MVVRVRAARAARAAAAFAATAAPALVSQVALLALPPLPCPLICVLVGRDWPPMAWANSHPPISPAATGVGFLRWCY